jgi:hypothetical protein
MMLAYARRIQSVLPRPLAFSTIPPRQDDTQKSTKKTDVTGLIDMLDKQALEVSPIIPGEMNHSNQSLYLYCPNFKFIHCRLL